MKLLLHICCGPCSLYVIDNLREYLAYEEHTITGIYANPNIHPYDEFIRRKESTAAACSYKDIPFIVLDDFDMEKWENFSGEREKRCEMCYTIRLNRVCNYAKENGFTHFTTTLLVSPYQDHMMIKAIGEKLAKENDIEFLFRDFSVGFREGQKQARDIGLYRQKYCGCIKSLYEK